MFDNIGGKIKALAKVVCWCGIIASTICAIAAWSQNSRYQNNTINGIIILVVGCLISWIGSFYTYGFGQLIENSDIIKNKLIANPANSTVPFEVVTTTKKDGDETTRTMIKSAKELNEEQKIMADYGWRCPKCGKANYKYTTTCSCGGKKFDKIGI